MLTRYPLKHNTGHMQWREHEMEPPVQPKPVRYHNFILSVWQPGPGSPTAPEWRYRLENPYTGERTGFTSLEAMMRYLQAWTVATTAATE